MKGDHTFTEGGATCTLSQFPGAYPKRVPSMLSIQRLNWDPGSGFRTPHPGRLASWHLAARPWGGKKPKLSVPDLSRTSQLTPLVSASQEEAGCYFCKTTNQRISTRFQKIKNNMSRLPAIRWRSFRHVCYWAVLVLPDMSTPPIGTLCTAPTSSLGSGEPVLLDRKVYCSR